VSAGEEKKQHVPTGGLINAYREEKVWVMDSRLRAPPEKKPRMKKKIHRPTQNKEPQIRRLKDYASFSIHKGEKENRDNRRKRRYFCRGEISPF